MQSESRDSFKMNIPSPELESHLMDKMINMMKLGDSYEVEKREKKLKKKLQKEEKRQQKEKKQEEEQEMRLIAETALNSLDNMFIRLDSIDCPKIRNIIFIENFMQVLQISIGFFQAYSNSLPEDIRERIGVMSGKLMNQMNQLTKVMQHVNVTDKKLEKKVKNGVVNEVSTPNK